GQPIVALPRRTARVCGRRAPARRELSIDDGLSQRACGGHGEEVAGIRLPRDGHPVTQGGREAGRRNLGERSKGGPAPDPGGVDAVRGPGYQPNVVTLSLRY